MDRLKEKANSLRRNLMRGLTKNIGNKHIEYNGVGTDVQIRRILVSRPNARLGNLLLITPLLEELILMFPDCEIDLFVKGNSASQIFKEFPNVKRIIELPKKPFSNLFQYAAQWMAVKSHKYDLAINVAESSSSGRLATKFATAKFKIFGDVANDLSAGNPDYLHMAKHPVYNFRNFLNSFGIVSPKTIAPMSLRLTQSEIDSGKKILDGLVGRNRPVISLFTNATGRKCYSEEWWDTFYKRLVSEYPQCAIVEVLPIDNESKIGFRAPSFYSKHIREIGAVIANTTVFIGADSGIMHLASAAGTPTIALFSVTNADRYKPYNYLSAAIDTNKDGLDKCFMLIDSIIHRLK